MGRTADILTLFAPREQRLVRWLARAGCRIFYRIDRVGLPPATGPVLMVPNHPNALLDPAAIWATAERDVRFLAKSGLFEGPWGPVLRGARAIPVYRKIDQGADLSKNTEAFAAVDAALKAGDAVCIFPEGISHSTGRLEPLRTGAARMALSAERAGVPVALVPVGLNFERKTAFRSRVTIIYGPPFSCADLVKGAVDPGGPAIVHALTDRIAEHMRRLLIEADPRADAAIVDRVDRLYSAARKRGRDPLDRVARRRAIAGGIGRLRAIAPVRYEEILLRVRRYDERLLRFGLRDRHLDWQVTRADAIRFALREILAGLVLVPLCAVAMAVFFVPYHLTAVAARWFTREPDVRATAKVVGGALIYGAWLALVAALAWWLAGRRAALVILALLPIVAVAGLFAIERESAVLDAVRAWWLLQRTAPDTRARLRKRRSELADILDEVNAWLTAQAAGRPPEPPATGGPSVS
jgi:1-acyl-sn-glycerol-3-phosphate acyltransferase